MKSWNLQRERLVTVGRQRSGYCVPGQPRRISRRHQPGSIKSLGSAGLYLKVRCRTASSATRRRASLSRRASAIWRACSSASRRASATLLARAAAIHCASSPKRRTHVSGPSFSGQARRVRVCRLPRVRLPPPVINGFVRVHLSVNQRPGWRHLSRNGRGALVERSSPDNLP